MDIKGSNSMVVWLGNVIPMRAPPTPTTEENVNAFAESHSIEIENAFLEFDSFDNHVSKYTIPNRKM